MSELSSNTVMDGCTHRLSGHGTQSMQKTLLALADFVDPHTSKDVYGGGVVMERFEEKIAACLGKEAAVFMPSGTMAQQIALRYWADRSGKSAVGMHPTSHLYQHEHHAYAKLHGLSAVLVGDACRQLVPSDLESLTTPLGALILELPQRHNGGTLPTWDELLAICAWAKDHAVSLHLDGARLWEARTYYARPEAEIAALFDSVYVSFYKGLGGIGGAMLLGSEALITEAKIWQRRHGGNLFQLFPFVVAADLGFERYRPRMDAYASTAKDIARVIGSLTHVKVTPTAPPTNMMHLTFDRPQAQVIAAALATSAETGLWILQSLWQRPFSPEIPVFELVVGEATMRAGPDLVSGTLRRFDERLALAGE